MERAPEPPAEGCRHPGAQRLGLSLGPIMRNHRLLLALACTVAGATTLPAQGTMLRPAPSGRGISEVTLRPPEGQAPDSAKPLTIRVDYGQPHLRGRTLHTDSLVPYDTPWRTGANDPTTLTTDVDLVIGGASVPKGTYVLFTIPSRTTWKLVLQKNAGQGAEYDQANDVARVDLRRQTLPMPVESLTMWLVPSVQPGPGRGELRLAWGTTMVSTDWAVK
jgi:hypothetical protein